MHDHSLPWSTLQLVSSRLLGSVCVALSVLLCKMDSERRWQERSRLSPGRELYRLRMVRETPKEREAQLIRQQDYMYRRRTNERQ